MPSYRSLFVLAATAFGALVSAAPVAPAGVNQLGNVVGVVAGQNVHTGDVNALSFDHHKRQTLPGLNTISDVLPANLQGLGVPALAQRHGDELHSLPVTLLRLQAALSGVSGKLNVIVAAKAKVDAEVILPLLETVRVALCGAVEEVQAIYGHPIELVLSLEGKVLSLVDVCRIILTILSLLGAILTCVLRIIATASIEIITPAIHGIADVLAELLCAVFGLVDGLQIALHPFLGPIIQICIDLKLDAVVKVLHGNF